MEFKLTYIPPNTFQCNFKRLFNIQDFISRWAFLEVYTSGAFSNEIQAYSAGWVEGYVTKDLIDMAWINNGAGTAVSTYN